MSTDLQRDLAEAIVINAKKPRAKRKNKKEMLVSVGYKTSVAETKPKDIIEAKGVKDALREFGLTEELITTALVADIQAKPKSRVKELGLGADILGMRKEEKGNTVNIQINSVSGMSNEQLEALLKQNENT